VEVLDLQDLPDHPGWKALKKHFENGHEGYGKSLTGRIMSGEVVSQREIDYYRGVIDAAKAIMAYPDVALARLETTARAGWQSHLQSELERMIGSDNPFIEQGDGDE